MTDLATLDTATAWQDAPQMDMDDATQASLTAKGYAWSGATLTRYGWRYTVSHGTKTLGLMSLEEIQALLDQPLDATPSATAAPTLCYTKREIEAWAVAYFGPMRTGKAQRISWWDDTRFPRPDFLPEGTIEIDLKHIVKGRFQPRKDFDTEALEGLAQSITEHGVITPIHVVANEDGFFELVSGERRTRAARLAGLATIPAEVRSMTYGQLRDIALLDNIQRENLSALEEADALCFVIDQATLAKRRPTDEELARRFGKSRGWVQQREALGRSAPALREALKEGKLTATQARGILAVTEGDIHAQNETLKTILVDKSGRVLNEADCKQIASTALVKASLSRLKALGWKANAVGTEITIWSDSEKPRVVTGPTITKMLATSTKPQGQPIETGELTSREGAALWFMHGASVGNNYYAPWIAFKNDYLTIAQLRDLAAAATAEYDAWGERLKPHGWTLPTIERYPTARHEQGASKNFYDRAALEAFIEAVEAQKQPTKDDFTAYRQPSICSRCNQTKDQLVWRDRDRICTDCESEMIAEFMAWLSDRRRALAERFDMAFHALDMAGLQSLAVATYHTQADIFWLPNAKLTTRQQRESLLTEFDRDALITLIYNQIATTLPALAPTWYEATYQEDSEHGQHSTSWSDDDDGDEDDYEEEDLHDPDSDEGDPLPDGE